MNRSYKDNYWMLVATNLLQTFVIILINNEITESTNLTALQNKLPYINCFILLTCILNIVSIRKLEQDVQYRIRVQLIKDHFHQVESLLESLQIQKHEYSRHMQTIQALVELNKIDDAKEYINGISNQYWQNTDITYIGHPVLSGLINSKKNVARLQGIDFAIAVKCDLSKLSIPSWDLCSIFGNLLDNAIEAAIQDESKPRIGIEFKYEDSNYTTYIINNGCQITNKQKIFEAGYTTKGSSGRGYGLYLVKKLVDQYNGEIEFISKGKTTAIVKLPGLGRMDDTFSSTKIS